MTAITMTEAEGATTTIREGRPATASVTVEGGGAEAEAEVGAGVRLGGIITIGTETTNGHGETIEESSSPTSTHSLLTLCRVEHMQPAFVAAAQCYRVATESIESGQDRTDTARLLPLTNAICVSAHSIERTRRARDSVKACCCYDECVDAVGCRYVSRAGFEGRAGMISP